MIFRCSLIFFQDYNKIAKQIRNHYFGNLQVNATTLHQYYEAFSDVAFNYAIDRSVRIQAAASTGRTYYYR